MLCLQAMYIPMKRSHRTSNIAYNIVNGKCRPVTDLSALSVSPLATEGILKDFLPSMFSILKHFLLFINYVYFMKLM
ncbi:hypothetical protein DsansV1_C03g0028961 [Dioscorea sansibarensis]